MYHKILESNPSIKKVPFVIADDSEVSRKVCEKFLRDAGFEELHFAVNGNEAYEMIEKFSAGIVVADIFMPNMNGFELVQKLRNNEATKDIAILVHTAATSSKDINNAFIMGANDVVLKPVQKEGFLTRCTMHLENSIYRKRVSEELEKARVLQNTIMPTSEDLKNIKLNTGVDIGFKFQPSSELGGDFWGTKQISATEVALFCVDLTGHGIASALNSFRVHSLIEENIRNFKKPNEFLEKINSVLSQIMPTGQYATMFYGIVNIEKDTLQYSNAASPYPIHIKSNGETKILKGSNLPVAVSKDTKYDVVTESFNKGDVLVIFSDALSESSNPEGGLFTEDKISKTVAKSVDRPAQEISDNLYARLTSFTGKNTFDDDLTICVFKMV